MSFGIGDMIGGIGGIISGGIGAIMQNESNNKAEKRNDKALEVQKDIAEQNLSLQRHAFMRQEDLNNRQFKFNEQLNQQQQDLNRLVMSREDNAVQRRVEDLKAAGLNPVLAAGSSAGSATFSAGNSMGSQRTAPAPQLDSSHFGAWAQRSAENARLGLNARLGFANLALDFFRQKADISRSEAETALLWQRAKSMEETRPLNVENMTLANSFLKQSFDVRLEQKYADLDATQKENLIRDRKAELLDKQIDYEDVRYLMGYADYLLKGKYMDKADKELLVMDSLLRARQMEYDINEWNLKYFKDRDLPTSYRDPTEIKIFKSIFENGFSEELTPFFDSVFNALPQNIRDDITRNLEAYKAKTGKDFHNFAPTKNNLKYSGKSGYQS